MKSFEKNYGDKNLIDVVKEAPGIFEKIRIMIYSAKVKDWVTFITATGALTLAITNAAGLNLGSDLVNNITQGVLGVIAVISVIKNKTE
jgi:hypothetical protein